MDPLAVLISMAAAMTLGAVAAAIGRFVRRDEPSLLVPSALAAACCVLFVQQQGWPTPADAGGPLALAPMWASILVACAAVAIVVIADATGPERWRTSRHRSWITAVIAAAAVYVTLRLPGEGAWNPSTLAALAIVPIGLASAPLARRHRGFSWMAAIAFSYAGLAALTLESGFAKAGVIAGGTGAALGAAAIVSWRTRVGLGVAANVAALAILATFAALGRAYADDAATPFDAATLARVWRFVWIVPAIAPLAAWIAEWGPLARRPRLAAIARSALPAGLALAPAAIAFGLAAGEAPDPYR
ncbi:MAG: hypothetical protein U0572_05810 [Phycisphaerales bacterium]